MAYANGRIPTSKLTKVPNQWNTKNRTEHLENSAYASLSRMIARAVAETGSIFNLNDAYRDFDEQVAMLKKNYTRVSRARSKSSDRSYGGSTWAKKPGRPLTASPGYSNHGNGVAIDIVPAAIQAWLRSNAGRFGWVNDVPSEPWHWSYLNPGKDQYRSEGVLDHGWVQKIVGAEVDHKIGPATVKLIKAWQKKHGLDADGKVGPATKAAMKGKAGSAPAPSAPAPGKSDGATVAIGDLPTVETGKSSPNSNTDRRGHDVKHVTVHWWGTPKGQSFDGIVDWLCDPKAQVSAHYVISATRVARIVDEKHRSWANGNGTANSESITIECDPNDVAGTLPVLAALIKDIRGRHGDLPIYPHQHWTSTACPGDYLPHLDAVDKLARTGEAVVDPGKPAAKPKPSTSKAPAFPLPRRKGAMYYYGPASGPKTSVSGRGRNTGAPGDVVLQGGRWYSKGLKLWQQRMLDRGWSGIGVADGRYGPKTERVVRQFQKSKGLGVDGKIGPGTWDAAWEAPVK